MRISLSGSAALAAGVTASATAPASRMRREILVMPGLLRISLFFNELYLEVNEKIPPLNAGPAENNFAQSQPFPAWNDYCQRMAGDSACHLLYPVRHGQRHD